MKHKSIYLLIALVAIASMMVSACVATPAPAPPEEAAPAEEPAEEAAPTEEELTIALSIPGLQFPFFVFMEQQVKDEAAKIGGIEIVTLDAQDRVDKQTADIEAAIAKGYDGILISPMTADAMAPAVQQAVDAGIPVVTIDRTVYDVDTLAHVGADNVLGGEQQGEALLELFPDGAVIFELTGTPGSSPAIDRSTGLHNIIDDRPEFEVACQQTADFNRDQGLTVTENCLGATPNPAAIIGANDEMAFGASEAAKGLGISDEVVIVGYDALPEALIAVRDGDLWGTVDQFPGEQSRVGLRTLTDFIWNDNVPAEHDIFIQPKMITQDNLDEAERANEIQ
jgi:ABC-type sugar transport system substrate-binding protein